MAVLRDWRAEVRRELAEEYADYVRATGIAAYRATPGNLWAAVAVRNVDEQRSEILTLSLWRSREAIQAFAGPDWERARYFPEDDKYLLTRPESVLHFDCEFHSEDGINQEKEPGRC